MIFTSIVEDFNTNLWGYHFVVPSVIANAFIEGKNSRVLCSIHNSDVFPCALMPKGDGNYYILLNKERRDKLKLTLGMSLEITLSKDESSYGLPMPEEMATLLELDDEANRLFHLLTAGKQRSLLYIVGKPKLPDNRLKKAVTIVEHLKRNLGKLDFKQLNEDFKEQY